MKKEIVMQSKTKDLMPIPLFDYVLITANTMKENKTESGIIIPESSQKELYLPNQIVVSKGKFADQVEVGDEIILNVDDFLRPVRKPKGTETLEDTMEYRLPIEEIGGKEYMRVQQRSIKYIVPKE